MGEPVDILLIEDNPGDVRLIREMLREGYSSHGALATAESIMKARAQLQSRAFGVIILDLNLPDSSGLSSLDEIIDAAGGNVPVIVLTGLADEETGHSAIERGAGDYLVKGTIDSKELSRSIRYAMERHQIARSLKNSEQFLREALDALSANIAILDAGGIILQVNKAWREFAERNGAVVENVCEGADYFEACLRDEQGKAFAAGIRSVMSGERSTFEMEYPCHSPDEERWFRGTVTRFREESPTRVVVAHDNLTERKKAEMKLEELFANLERMVAERTAELEKANRELESFSYTVSHDLRAPLRHIHGFMELFRQEMGEVSNENAKHYMDVIGASAQRMSQLIDDLLSFSRMGRAEYSVTDVDMTSLVAEAAQSLREEMESRSMDLRIGGLPAVRGDRSMMLVVFSNLLSNAVKFTSKRERPEISVSGEKAGEEAVFCVRDNGAGFDMRYADKLFGVFNRLHRESEYPGTGIGLATVRRIIERHGGRVWAEGAVDEGARFCFALPLRAGSSDRT